MSPADEWEPVRQWVRRVLADGDPEHPQDENLIALLGETYEADRWGATLTSFEVAVQEAHSQRSRATAVMSIPLRPRGTTDTEAPRLEAILDDLDPQPASLFLLPPTLTMPAPGSADSQRWPVELSLSIKSAVAEFSCHHDLEWDPDGGTFTRFLTIWA